MTPDKPAPAPTTGAWASWRSMAKQRGWRLAWLYALHRVLGIVSRGKAGVVPYELVAQPIGTGKLGAVRDDPGTVVQVARAGDAVTTAFPRPAAINQWRWDEGATCHVATVKGEFAGTLWTQRKLYREDEVRCDFVLDDPRTVWDFDVYVVPRYRLGRTMGRLWKAVDAALAAEGVRWTFSRISRFNADSLNAHARLGAVSVGQVDVLFIGPLQLSWSRTGGRHRFACGVKQRVRIGLSPPPGG